MPNVFSNPSGVAPPIGAYSHVAVVPAGSDLLFLAGQVGMLPDGTVPATPEQQFVQALRNVVAILADQGCTPHNLVRLTTYLVGPMDLASTRALRHEILDGAKPATTMIYVPRLFTDEFFVEVEAIGAR